MRDWTGTHVIVVGAARQGLALARYLSTHGAHVVLNDNRPAGDLAAGQAALSGLPIEWVTGGHPLEILAQAELVAVSGGVSLENLLVAEAARRGLPLTNDSQIFMEGVSCPTVGITGSAGKTTTTTLVGRMAQAGGPDAGQSLDRRQYRSAADLLSRRDKARGPGDFGAVELPARADDPLAARQRDPEHHPEPPGPPQDDGSLHRGQGEHPQLPERRRHRRTRPGTTPARGTWPAKARAA